MWTRALMMPWPSCWRSQSPELQIEAITGVSGNVLVDQGLQNALKLVELAGPDPIFR